VGGWHFGKRRPSRGPSKKAVAALFCIAAMAMETAIHVEKNGVVARPLVKAGDQIDANDLAMAFAD
jgi:pyruvate carboxylase